MMEVIIYRLTKFDHRNLLPTHVHLIDLVRVLIQPHRADYERIRQSMELILSKNARSYVDLKTIFTFCAISS